MAANTLARGLGSGAGRTLSLLLAIPLSLIVLLHPFALVDHQGGYSHGLLALAMWGISAGFVHGLGFEPRALAWRWLVSPWVAWPLVVLGYWLLRPMV
jgi:cyd operon protein YbgE